MTASPIIQDFVVLALISLLVLVAACSSAPQPRSPPPPQLAPPQAEQVVQTQPPSQALNVSSPSVPPPSSSPSFPPLSADAKTALETLLKRGATLAFSATYDVSETYQGETQQSTAALYVKGDEVRTDISGTVNGQQTENRAIFTPSAMVSCMKDAAWQCLRFDAVNASENVTGVPQPNATSGDLFNGTLITRVADRSIAGAHAACFSLVTATPNGTVTEQQCYSQEGVPLSLSITGPAGSMTRQANSYSLAVPDSAFTPPATPQSAKDLLQTTQ